MVAYPYTMPVGTPGHLSRGDLNCVVEQLMLDAATLTPALYGIPVKVVSGKAQTIAGGDVAASVYGFTVREYPTGGSLGSVNNAFGVTGLNTSVPQGILKSGYINVLCNNSSVNPPVKNGPVYVRIAAAAGGKPLGGVEAAADSTNTIIVPNTYFMGGCDSSGNTEIAYNV